MLSAIILFKLGQLSSGLNSCEIDLSTLNSGTYFHNIIIDGILVEKGKVNIVK